MPIDQRRINGPESSIPYTIYTQDEEPKKQNQTKRRDGRKTTELRKMFTKVGIISQAKGSAYIEMGTTKVVCSVFDPREIPNKIGYSVQGELYCEFKFSSFSCSKRRIHQQDSEEKEYSLILQRALEPAVCLHEFPNFQVDVYAVVLDNGGSALAAAIMAASLALANAGVPMYGLVTGSTVVIGENTKLLDPTDEEETLCDRSSKSFPNHGIVMQASLPQHSQISEIFLVGNVDLESINESIELMNNISKEICPVLEQCLVKSIVKSKKQIVDIQ